MTQPDLVSKLREVIAKLRKQRPEGSMSWDIADELESFIGLEGQTAVRLLPEQPRPDIAPDLACGPSQPETEGEIGRQPSAEGSPSVQAVNSDVALAHSAFLSPSTPIVPGTAGLSAAKVQSWTNNCAVYERQHAAIGDFAGVEYHRGAKEAFQRVADALLGATQPTGRWQCEQCACLNYVSDAKCVNCSAERPAPAGEVKGEK